MLKLLLFLWKRINRLSNKLSKKLIIHNYNLHFKAFSFGSYSKNVWLYFSNLLFNLFQHEYIFIRIDFVVIFGRMDSQRVLESQNFSRIDPLPLILLSLC